jgi:hypothetical protein
MISYALGAFTTIVYEGEDCVAPIRINLVSLLACPSGSGKSIITSKCEKHMEVFRKKTIPIMYSIYDRSLEDESPTPTTSEAESIVNNLTQVNINDEVAVQQASNKVSKGKKKKFHIPKVSYQK